MQIGPVRIHRGVCDASAAVFLDGSSSHFVVADDEDQERTILRVYDADADGDPLAEHHLSNAVLRPDHEEPEIDLEGSAWLGDRIFWIGSHSRSRKGKPRPSRHRLFATTVRGEHLEISGRPYCTLLRDLQRVLDVELDPPTPPKSGGLSIEGLASTPSARELYIAFRSPLVNGKALIVPLENADEIVDHEAPAVFGEPVLLHLAGRGIRSLEYWPERTSWLLIAGPEGEGAEPFSLMRWSGPCSSQPEELSAVRFDALGIEGAPEGLLIHRSTGAVHVLFDEGNRIVNDLPCKKLALSEQSFRSISFTGLLPALPGQRCG